MTNMAEARGAGEWLPIPEAGELERLLQRVAHGDAGAETELLASVYVDLKRMAAACLRRERPDHTLQATALVHEAYLKMVGRPAMQWVDRGHFFAVAAQIMRRILADHGRHRRALKRGAGCATLCFDDSRIGGSEGGFRFADLDEALTRLATFAPRQAQVVELRFFGGMTEEEIAAHLAVCARTVKRDWIVAKAWLYGALAS